MKVALDTNILAYAEGVNSAGKRDAALALIRRLPQGEAIIPAQVLGELYNVLVRKGGKSRTEARDALLNWSDAFPSAPTSPEIMMIAAALSCDHQLGIWDAVIFVAAAQSGCRLLLSEDLHEGFTWAGVTVVNPFSTRPNALLQALLDAN